MIGTHMRRLGGFALALLLAPSAARAQTGQSFEEVQGLLAVDEIVVVIDQTSQEIRGRVEQVSVSALVLVIPDKTSRGLEIYSSSAKRIFTADSTAEIWRADRSGRRIARIYFAAARSEAIRKAQQTSKTYFRREVFASIGRGTKASEYREYPAWANVGAGMAIRLSRRVGAEFELNRMLGTSLLDASGVVVRAASGLRTPYEARAGVSSMTTASANILFYFSDKRAQPYLSGGIGTTWDRGAFVSSSNVPPTEEAYRSTDTGPTLGGGVRISITPRISLRPEFRLHVVANVARTSVAAAYQW